MRSRFSTLASFRAQVVASVSPLARTRTSMVMRSSTVYRPVTTRSTASARSAISASARKPTWPRLTPSRGVRAGRASSAARSSVPSPPSTISTSASSAAAELAGTTSTPGTPISSASGSMTRTVKPASRNRWITSRALSTAGSRPVWAVISTVRFALSMVHSARPAGTTGDLPRRHARSRRRDRPPGPARGPSRAR